MNVIGAGFGRTGTLSLKAALEQLGFGPCLHMVTVLGDPERSKLLSDAADGDPDSLDAAFAGFRSSVDWPGTYFWRELTARHPDAQVVLTERDPEQWYDSAYRTIYQAQGRPPAEDTAVPAARAMLKRLIWDGTFGGNFADREAMVRLFQEHNAAVRAEIAPDRLLVYRVADGWGPLCEFLGVPVPDGPFPRLNDTETFNNRISAGRSGS